LETKRWEDVHSVLNAYNAKGPIPTCFLMKREYQQEQVEETTHIQIFLFLPSTSWAMSSSPTSPPAIGLDRD
jgi:hypothetical protein